MQLPAAAGVPICLCLARSPCPGLAWRQHGAPPARLPPLPGRSTVREERGAEAQPGPGAGPARRTRSGRTPAVQAAGTRGAPCSPGQLGWGRRPRAIRWEAAQDLGARCRVPVQQPQCHPCHVLGVGPTPGRAWDRRPCEGTPGHGVPPDTVTQQGRKTVGRLAESHGGVWRGPWSGVRGGPGAGCAGPWSGVRGGLEWEPPQERSRLRTSPGGAGGPTAPCSWAWWGWAFPQGVWRTLGEVQSVGSLSLSPPAHLTPTPAPRPPCAPSPGRQEGGRAQPKPQARGYMQQVPSQQPRNLPWGRFKAA